jgi:hypothetical protein
MDPTIGGFIAFITGVMGVPSTVLVTSPPAPVIQFSYDQAINTVLQALQGVPSQLTSPSVYATAVYNLAADQLITYAPDSPSNVPPTYWANLRQSFGLNTFQGGVINFSSDSSTSTGYTVSDSLKNITIGDLLNLKTSYGRNYLAIAQAYGTLWGIS